MNVPAELKYTTSHEWAKLEADGTVTVGITDHAQEALGDIVFLELPFLNKRPRLPRALETTLAGWSGFE